MNKKEFIEILRQSLVGEVTSSILEQNISFYNEYISSHSDKSEEEIIDEIGDPRLIARTIIETERIPDQGSFGSNNYNDYSNRQYYDEYDKNKGQRNTSDRSSGAFRIKWYHKWALIGIVILLAFILIRAGWLLLKLLSVFIVPIIIISILWYMFREV